MRNKKVTDTYIAVLPEVGTDDEDIAIVGVSVDDTINKIKDYLYETRDYNDDDIANFIDTEGGINIYKVAPRETTRIYAEIETKMHIRKESLA